jgi:chromosome segregation ATPase
MSNGSPSGVAAGRSLWVGLGLVVLALLGVTVPLAAASVDDAETAARERSVRVVREVLAGAVTPELVASDIADDDRRAILELVRTRILADERFARVLIWRPDGDLIFSSVSPTHVAVIGEESNLAFAQAIGGVPSSVVVDATETTVAFHRTYVPLEALGASDAYAVVEVDQRYGPIHAEATRRWRVAQVVLLSSFGALVVLVGVSSLVGRRRRAAPKAEAASEREELAIEALEARVEDAELRAQRAEEKLRVAERRIKDAAALEIPPDVLARVEEAEEALARETAERERATEQAWGLAERLEATEAELARAKEVMSAAEAEIAQAREQESARAAQQIQELTRRAADAEGRAEHESRRAAAAELRAAELAERLATTEAKVAELEGSLREARGRLDRAAKDAERMQQELEQRVRSQVVAAQRGLEQRASGDMRAVLDDLEKRAEEVRALQRGLERKNDELATAHAEVDTLRRRVAELEAAPRASGKKGRRPEPAQAEWDAMHARLAELEAAQRESGWLRERLAELEAEVAQARQRATELEGELAEARSRPPEPLPSAPEPVSPQGPAAMLEVQLLRDERDVARAELERARHELKTAREELVDVRTRLAELEARQRDEVP